MKISFLLRIFILSIAAGALLAPLAAPAQTPSKRKAEMPKEELSLLNRAIQSADMYKHDKNMHLDTLKRLEREQSANSMKKWELTNRISEEYLPVRADSSMKYAERALGLATANGWDKQTYISRIAFIKALATSGIFTQASEEFMKIDPATLDKQEKILYLEAGRRLYGYMRGMVESEKKYYNVTTEKYLQYNDSLEAILPDDSPLKHFLTAENLITTGHYTDAKPILEHLLETHRMEDNLYGMAAFQLATVYNHLGDDNQYAAYLAKAAVSDIRGCINDGLALPTLAYWMYEQGELNDAYRYINCALKDATSGNARTRTIMIASMLPIIDEAYREKISASRDEMMIYFLLVTFLLVISGILLTFLIRQMKRSRKNSEKLSRTSRLQENYIGHFITLSSTYANRIKQMQKTVTRKIKAGQTDELLKIMNSTKVNEDLQKEFYTTFDSAFLDLYPDFIDEINELLRPEERIYLKEKDTLPPELRIYAFVHIGIVESTQIANILNYSASTVYAYRTRIRNKAINRDTFDEAIAPSGHLLPIDPVYTPDPE